MKEEIFHAKKIVANIAFALVLLSLYFAFEYSKESSNIQLDSASAEELLTPALISGSKPADSNFLPQNQKFVHRPKHVTGVSPKPGINTRPTTKVNTTNKKQAELGIGCSGIFDRVLFVHYHKTGAFLSKKLVHAIFNRTVGKWGCVHRRRQTLPHEICLPNFGPTVQPAPQFSAAWPESFRVRVIHMIRDVLDMSISSYFYHAEIPPPPPERWLHDIYFDPCSSTKPGWQGLVRMAQNTGITLSALRAVRDLCHIMTAHAHAKIRSEGTDLLSNYSAVLAVLSPINGLILDTCRNLISSHPSAGGDVLRMASNKRYLRSAELNGCVLTSRMHDFIGNESAFRHAVRRICKFTMPSSEPEQKSSQAEDSCVAEAVRSAYIGTPGVVSTSHVTHTRASNEMREHMKTVLREHSILGPVLAKLNKLILV